jgi:pimeloyl-ACP methyl ester carboxylesterase
MEFQRRQAQDTGHADQGRLLPRERVQAGFAPALPPWTAQLVMHGEDDQIVPIADTALLSVKLLKHGTLKVYEKLPHGMCTTHAEVVNPDLLAFIRG